MFAETSRLRPPRPIPNLSNPIRSCHPMLPLLPANPLLTRQILPPPATPGIRMPDKPKERDETPASKRRPIIRPAPPQRPIVNRALPANPHPPAPLLPRHPSHPQTRHYNGQRQAHAAPYARLTPFPAKDSHPVPGEAPERETEETQVTRQRTHSERLHRDRFPGKLVCAVRQILDLSIPNERVADHFSSSGKLPVRTRDVLSIWSLRKIARFWVLWRIFEPANQNRRGKRWPFHVPIERPCRAHTIPLCRPDAVRFLASRTPEQVIGMVGWRSPLALNCRVENTFFRIGCHITPLNCSTWNNCI